MVFPQAKREKILRRMQRNFIYFSRIMEIIVNFEAVKLGPHVVEL